MGFRFLVKESLGFLFPAAGVRAARNCFRANAPWTESRTSEGQTFCVSAVSCPIFYP